MNQKTNFFIDIFTGLVNYANEVASLLWLKISFSAAVTLILQIVGYPHTAFIPLLILLSSDWVLGTCNSLIVKNERFSATRARHGAVKIVGAIGAIALVIQFDLILAANGIPGQYILANILILVLGTTELTSCAKHLDSLKIIKIDPRILKKITGYEDKVLGNEKGQGEGEGEAAVEQERRKGG